jgi:predicted metal-binding protein
MDEKTMTEAESLLLAAQVTGVQVHEYAKLPVSSLTFSAELLKSCRSNVCGNYNKSWTCPPACGTMEEQRENILSYKEVLVFTTRHELEDSFDYEGMTRARELHSLLTLEFKRKSGKGPVYGAGNCPYCNAGKGKNNCSYPEPCPWPEEKIGSIEAAGINVTELSRAAGITYNNGPNTVTFFSIALFR